MSITASVYENKVFYKLTTVLAVVDRLFLQLGTHFSGCCRCKEVTVVERFKQELMYGLSAGTKNVAVVEMERWPLVEVRLHITRKVRNTIDIPSLRIRKIVHLDWFLTAKLSQSSPFRK